MHAIYAVSRAKMPSRLKCSSLLVAAQRAICTVDTALQDHFCFTVLRRVLFAGHELPSSEPLTFPGGKYVLSKLLLHVGSK